MTRPLKLVFVGLTLSSSWGNGHATTYRSLLRGLHRLGHEVHFLERDVPWYAEHRDLDRPFFCALHYYSDLNQLKGLLQGVAGGADALIVGSYVPEGVEVIDLAGTIEPAALCFYDIDTPVTLARLDRGDEEYLARRQMSLFDIYFSFSGGTVLDRLELEYGARRALPLYCSVDPARYAGTGEPVEWDLGYLGTYSPDRQPVLERLLIEPARRLPARRFVVAGPQYPSDIAWPDNVERIDHLPPEKHASFYSRQRFTLNATRSDMAAMGFSPSVRLFEAAACGTPIVSDRWQGLADLFPEGEAITIADTPEDVVRLLETLPESKRRSMADEARALVLAGHTGLSRASELVRGIAGSRALAPVERRAADPVKRAATYPA